MANGNEKNDVKKTTNPNPNQVGGGKVNKVKDPLISRLFKIKAKKGKIPEEVRRLVDKMDQTEETVDHGVEKWHYSFFRRFVYGFIGRIDGILGIAIFTAILLFFMTFFFGIGGESIQTKMFNEKLAQHRVVEENNSVNAHIRALATEYNRQRINEAAMNDVTNALTQGNSALTK